MRDQNIPILNDFKENFLEIKYESEIRIEQQQITIKTIQKKMTKMNQNMKTNRNYTIPADAKSISSAENPF